MRSRDCGLSYTCFCPTRYIRHERSGNSLHLTPLPHSPLALSTAPLSSSHPLLSCCRPAYSCKTFKPLARPASIVAGTNITYPPKVSEKFIIRQNNSEPIVKTDRSIPLGRHLRLILHALQLERITPSRDLQFLPCLRQLPRRFQLRTRLDQSRSAHAPSPPLDPWLRSSIGPRGCIRV